MVDVYVALIFFLPLIALVVLAYTARPATPEETKQKLISLLGETMYKQIYENLQ